jgi:hypothetical protein
MKGRTAIVFIAAVSLLSLFAPAMRAEESKAAESDTSAYLHVEVETSYGWFWQKSIGRAYVTAGRDSKQKINVGKLCVKLEAHDSHENCLMQVDSMGVSEKKRGIAIPKRTAKVTAWCEDPKLGPITVTMEP